MVPLAVLSLGSIELTGRKSMIVRLIFASMGLLVASCAINPRIDTDYDPTADFSQLRTYSWAFTSVPRGMSPLLYERTRASIDRSLAARSFTQASPGDFAIAFTVGARDRVDVTDFGDFGPFFPRYHWQWRGAHRIDVRQFREGTLAIDIYDVATRRPIWRGTATQELPRNGVDQRQVDAAVDAMLRGFPPASAR
jgi:hypothetical protein